MTHVHHFAHVLMVQAMEPVSPQAQVSPCRRNGIGLTSGGNQW